MNRVKQVVGTAVLAAGLCVCPAWGQGVATTPTGQLNPNTGVPQMDTLIRMSRKITVDFTDRSLRDVMEFIQQYTGADLDIKWRTDRFPDGLDPEEVVTARANNVSTLSLLERILEAVPADFGNDATWQMSDTGAMQIGPKSRLNQYRRIEIYDINDLLLELKDYTEVPELDLQSVLQSSRGGSGQSPFRDDQQENEEDRLTREQRAEEIIDLIIELVQPEQWVENGGEGGSIRYYRGTLIVNAPDYMHRDINGYTFWPKSRTIAGKVDGIRYVGLTTDTGISTIDDIVNQPVSAVVGGRIIRSGPPGGGG